MIGVILWILFILLICFCVWIYAIVWIVGGALALFFGLKHELK